MQVLEAFLLAFLDEERAARRHHAASAPATGGAPDDSSPQGPHPPRGNAADPAGVTLLHEYASLLAECGGNAGTASVFAAGTVDADSAAVVDASIAQKSAMDLLIKMHARATSGATSAKPSVTAVPHAPPAAKKADHWAPKADVVCE